MRIRNLMVGAALAMAATLLPVDGASAADAPDCTNGYLLCLNDATQEKNVFWRTLKETECGLGFVGCLRRKVSAG